MNNQERCTADSTSVGQLLVVTGLSGAGKSTVLRALEDSGFFCVDNLPIALLRSFFELAGQARVGRKVALGIDIRGVSNVAELVDQLEQERQRNPCFLRVVFLTASSAVLIKRFQETRRMHPLRHTTSLLDTIELEKKLLEPLAACADSTIDTDQLTIHQLRSLIKKTFCSGDQPPLLVNLISFGFKYGLPVESNFVFDLRSLPNPYFVAELKQFDGTHPAVIDFLFADPAVQEYWNRLSDFFTYCVKRAQHEGRYFISFAVGCTGGRHRSVAFIHKLAQHTISDIECVVKHRDIDHDNYQ